MLSNFQLSPFLYKCLAIFSLSRGCSSSTSIYLDLNLDDHNDS